MAEREKMLRDLVTKIVIEYDYVKPKIEIKPVSSGGANYSSTLYIITVTEENKDKLNLFAKITAVSNKVRESLDASDAFQIEAIVYTRLLKSYVEIEDKYNVAQKDRLYFPKFFGSHGEIGKETVILENVKAIGYDDVDRLKSVNWVQASAAIINLAKFHALSFALQKEDPEEFQYYIDRYKNKEHCLVAFAKQVLALGTWKEAVKDEYKHTINRFLEKMEEDLYRKVGKINDQPVLIHTDYRPSNMLFKIQGSEVQVMLVDYQTIFPGCPTFDLMYFISLGTDGKFRAEHYEQLLELYYQELSKALERLNLDVATVYPRHKYDSDLQDMLPSALLIGLVALPVIMVNPDEAPDLNGDADVYHIKPNKLCIVRLDELCADLERWGVI